MIGDRKTNIFGKLVRQKVVFFEEVGSHVFVFTLVLNAGDLLHGKVVGGRAHRGGSRAGEEIAVGGKGEASYLAHAARARMGGASGSWMRTCGVDSNQYSAADRFKNTVGSGNTPRQTGSKTPGGAGTHTNTLDEHTTPPLPRDGNHEKTVKDRESQNRPPHTTHKLTTDSTPEPVDGTDQMRSQVWPREMRRSSRYETNVHTGPGPARRARLQYRCFHFADRLRAGAGRRSRSGRRPGRVRWGRPLLSRPRGAFGSGAAAEGSGLLSRPRNRSSR